MKSLKISNDESTTEAIVQTPVVRTAGTYTFSGYMKLENVQSGRFGASLEVIVNGPNGYKYIYPEFITGTTDSQINNGFQHISVTFTLAQGEYIERLTAGLYYATGTVYIDSLQLEEGNTANQINLIDNSSFENSAGLNTVPSGYIVNFIDNSSGTVTYEKRDGNNSYRIDGLAGMNRFLLKELPFSGKAGEVYSFGGWAKGNTIL